MHRKSRIWDISFKKCLAKLNNRKAKTCCEAFWRGKKIYAQFRVFGFYFVQRKFGQIEIDYTELVLVYKLLFEQAKIGLVFGDLIAVINQIDYAKEEKKRCLKNESEDLKHEKEILIYLLDSWNLYRMSFF